MKSIQPDYLKECDRMKPPVIEPGKVVLGKIVEPRRSNITFGKITSGKITTQSIGKGDNIHWTCLRCGAQDEHLPDCPYLEPKTVSCP